MKYFLLLFLIAGSSFAKAQKIDSIYVNLYTDSLKRGTFNYINIDGRLQNGKYIPLDSSSLLFSSSTGYFKGNSLWVDKDIKAAKISIKVEVKNNPSLYKAFDIYVKQLPDNEHLKTAEEILNEIKQSPKKKH